MRTMRRRWVMLGAPPPPRPSTLPPVTELLSLGWGVLEEVPGRQLVLGAVTQPWQSYVVFRALPLGEFAAFDSAGYVKIVVTLAVDSMGPHASTFRTETRAVATARGFVPFPGELPIWGTLLAGTAVDTALLLVKALPGRRAVPSRRAAST